jgi:mono/diheme cytochrome c family protein
MERVANAGEERNPGVRRRGQRWVLAGLGVAALALVGIQWGVPAAMRARSSNPISRGREVARRSGCFDCHAVPHNLELANPESPFGTVPSFAGGNLMMYVDRAAEVEEWIRKGWTEKLRRDPAGWARYQRQLIQMPAFERRLSAAAVADLKAFVLAADGYHSPPDPAARRGEEIARAHCFGCHGVGGAGGMANLGSPFGYVPAWWGPDFRDLVRDETELREWIHSGSSQRVAAWPLVPWFWRRQAIRMPAYGEHLEPADLDALVAFIGWLGRTEGGTQVGEEAN